MCVYVRFKDSNTTAAIMVKITSLGELFATENMACSDLTSKVKVEEVFSLKGARVSLGNTKELHDSQRSFFHELN